MKIALSIIVPVMNEAEGIESFLNKLQLRIQTITERQCRVEVIVSDSGSTDGSLDILADFVERGSCILVKNFFASPSVGKAVFQGVKAASGSHIFILPCDCMPSPAALKVLVSVCTSRTSAWGGMAKSYLPSSSLMCFFASFQNYFLGYLARQLVWTNGFFGSKELFLEADEYCDEFLEDVRLSERLGKVSRGRWIEAPLVVSSRRYRHSPLKRICINGFIFLAFKLGYKNTKALKKIYLSVL